MVDKELFGEFVVIGGLGVATKSGLHLLGFPSTAGFLITGAITGPYGLGLVIYASRIEQIVRDWRDPAAVRDRPGVLDLAPALHLESRSVWRLLPGRHHHGRHAGNPGGRGPVTRNADELVFLSSHPQTNPKMSSTFAPITRRSR